MPADVKSAFDSFCPSPSVRHKSDSSGVTEPTGDGVFSLEPLPDDEAIDELVNDLHSEKFERVRRKAESFGRHLENLLPRFGSRAFDPLSQSAGDKVPHGRRVQKCYRKMVDEITRVEHDGETSINHDRRPRLASGVSIGNSCGNYSKICPHHARLEVARLIERYLPVIAESAERHHVYYMVISPPNIPPGHLAPGRDRDWSIWNRLRRRVHLSDRLAGALASEEFVISEDPRNWNHHINLILTTDDYLDFETINEDYREILEDLAPEIEGDYPLPEIDHVSEPLAWRDTNYPDFLEDLKDNLGEVIKYSAKFDSEAGESGKNGDVDGAGGMVNWNKFELREYLETIWGMRTSRGYGDFHAIPEPVRQEPDDEQTLAEIHSVWNRDSGSFDVDLIRVHNSSDGIEEICKLLQITPAILAECVQRRGPPSNYELEVTKNEIENR